MQDPISALATSAGYDCSAMNAPIALTVLRRSGVCGPTQAGSSSLRLISITRSKICSRAASTSSSARKCSACSRASAAIAARSVLSR